LLVSRAKSGGVRDPKTLEEILLTAWNQKGALPNSNTVEFVTEVPDFGSYFAVECATQPSTWSGRTQNGVVSATQPSTWSGVECAHCIFLKYR